MTDIAATAPVHGHADHAHDEHDHKPGFFVRWFMSTNHKDIGTLYLMFAIVAGIVGGVMSGLMRLDLAEPGIQYLHGWAQFFSSAPGDMPATQDPNNHGMGKRGTVRLRH